MAQLPKKNSQFTDWYQDVIYQAELVDQAPVRGSFVIRPYGYSIWENIQKELDRRIKETGHVNAAFPLLIPESFLKKEAEHVEGFSPELAVVTHAGGKELEEPLVVRPTSETIIHHMFARWIKSWRDLPLLINQWANVVRWEMRPRAFLRTTEFFWQEGHTAHETLEEAEAEVLLMLEQYRQLLEDYLAIPVIVGKKSESEKFPGAVKTFTLEAIMPDGKALQMCTSHLISRDFARAFNMTYQDREGKMEHPYLTSWGLTTRVVGALIMTHGDDKGLILPPMIAPVQVALIPIIKEGADNEQTIHTARTIADELVALGYNVIVDEDLHKTPGAKFYEWEMKGVPLRIELGPRDLAVSQVIIANRLTGEKDAVYLDNVERAVIDGLREMQKELYSRAKEAMHQHWHQAETLAEFAQGLNEKGGAYQTGWCQDPACEKALKQYKATIRCLLLDGKHANCFFCNKPSKTDIIVARAY